jgi:hypothetical protein
MAFDVPAGKTVKSLRVTVNGRTTESTHNMTEHRVNIELAEIAMVEAGQAVEIGILW